MQKISLMNFPITLGGYQRFIDEIVEAGMRGASKYVCVANVHMLVEASRDIQFSTVVHQADMVTPDGMPLTWGLRLLYGINQPRVAGMDLLPDLLSAATHQQLPVFFYGGESNMLPEAGAFIQTNFPQLLVAGMYSPPFRALTLEEEEEIIAMINASGARLVFVALGCPRQEKWMCAMKKKINAVMIGIGGALPVMIGVQKRAPLWMQQSGLEWLYRLLREPKRLFKRYAVTNTIFMYLLLKEYIRVRIVKRSLPVFLSK